MTWALRRGRHYCASEASGRVLEIIEKVSLKTGDGRTFYHARIFCQRKTRL